MKTNVVRGTSIAFLLAVALLAVPGCKKPEAVGPKVDNPTVSPLASPAESFDAATSANKILQRLLKTYRDAKSYQDQAVVKLSYKANGQDVVQDFPAAVAFERPNRLALDVYQAKVRIDGKRFKASIHDPDSGENLDGQVVVRTAPLMLKLADLASDPLLYDTLAGRPRRQPIQLELMLESRGLANAFADDVACQLLDDGISNGRGCKRIAVPSPGGNFIFWVDRENSLLRRLDYPAAALLPEVAQDPAVSQLQLWIEMPGAELDQPIAASRWQLTVPAGAKVVKSFLLPPRPLPSQLFGKQPSEFFFTTLDDKRLTQAQLTEKITVLCWYHENPACEATLQQVALAAREYRDHPKVAFYGVATDPSDIPSDRIRQTLQQWQAEIPVVRDLEAFGDKSFKIEFQPTVVVMNAKGQVQIFQSGGNPELSKQLGVIIERLLKGDDLAAEILTQFEREQTEYQTLVASGGREPEPVVELAEPVIRRRSEPKHIQLKAAWNCTELKSPGNILLVPPVRSDEEPKLLVCDGWRTIAEVSPVGKVVQRYELELPEQAAVTFLRTTVDKDGKRFFVGSSPLAPQWFLFDEQFKLLTAYPNTPQDSLRITDLQLADLDEDGTADVLAGNVGLLGLHATTLQGEVKWRNRTFPNVISVAVTRPNDVGSWQILVTGEQGSVLPLSRFGREDPAKKVASWPIARLAVASFPTPTQASFVGISNDPQGNLVAVGLTSQLRECWNYQLPPGAHQQPIDPIASSQVLEGHQGEWWFAAADGSVHLVSENGKLHDSFATGSVLSGLAVAKLSQGGLLLLSTTSGLSAWQVTAPQMPR
ncbi:TlpA family protein disulfide reductase [Anatilimnocola sp. NA78]|uniref:TlpA family protein disulfide reductase n=1 Tax=Anatilimnocola sp. NA78 TaxID=3415683 RepID=UPI003CE454B2